MRYIQIVLDFFSKKVFKKAKDFKDYADKLCRGGICLSALTTLTAKAVGTEAVMEIKNYSSAVSAYKSISSDYRNNAVKGGKTAAKSVKNTDTLEISSAAKANSLESAKAAVRKSIDKETPADRIAAIKAKIAEGTYSISPENVAAAIFEG